MFPLETRDLCDLEIWTKYILTLKIRVQIRLFNIKSTKTFDGNVLVNSSPNKETGTG